MKQQSVSPASLARLSALIAGVLLCAIVVMLNLVGMNAYGRLDLTQDRVFTLSDVSKKTMGGLKDVLQVKYYISRGILPPVSEYEVLEQEVADRLAEYQAFSSGKMRFEVIDPLDGRRDISREVRDRLEVEGVLASSDMVKKADQPFPIEFYSAVKLYYADKTEVINDIRNVTNFEYDFTRAVRRMTLTKLPTVGLYFTSPQAGLQQGGNYAGVSELLRKDCLVRTVDLGKDTPVPGDIDVLFVVAPEAVPDRHKYEIDQFIMRGGKVAFFLDCFNPAHMQQGAWGQQAVFMRVESNLDDMLASYGIRAVPSVIFDIDKCGVGRRPKRVATRIGFVEKMEIVRYPALIRTRKQNYEKGLSFINQLDDIAVRHAMYLEAAQSAGAATVTPLVRSSNRSWVILFEALITEKPFEDSMENPEKCIDENNSKGSQFMLAGLVEGKLRSFYADKDVPEPAKEEPPQGMEQPQKPPEPPRPKPETVKETAQSNRIVVIGDSDCISDDIVFHPPNAQFCANLVDWLSSGEDLSKIRSKLGRSRPLSVRPEMKIWWQLGMVGLMPFVIVAIGVGRSIMRRGGK
ncbi:MAG: GldG family protein [Planctomycetota bacterium]|nr:GldG family protein [Planctomycetota bacterium]